MNGLGVRRTDYDVGFGGFCGEELGAVVVAFDDFDVWVFG